MRISTAVALATTLALSASSCGRSEDRAYFEVSWRLVSNLGGPDGCAAAGAETIVFRSRLNPGDEPFVDRFDCLAGSGVTQPLPLGSYHVWLTALDAEGSLVASAPASGDPDHLLNGNLGVLDEAGASDSIPFDPVYYDTGAVHFEWTLSDATGALTCDAVAADRILVSMLPVGGEAVAFIEAFACDDNVPPPEMTFFYSQSLPLGQYDIVASLLDDQLLLAESPPQTTTLLYGNHKPDSNIEFVLAR